MHSKHITYNNQGITYNSRRKHPLIATITGIYHANTWLERDKFLIKECCAWINSQRNRYRRKVQTWKRALGNCGLESNSWRASSLFCVAIPCIITRTKISQEKRWLSRKAKLALPNSYLQLRDNLSQLTPGHFGQMQS